ncbi:hypothetical protein IWX91DRAFT_337566 [Phyllosticta citricarpa]
MLQKAQARLALTSACHCVWLCVLLWPLEPTATRIFPQQSLNGSHVARPSRRTQKQSGAVASKPWKDAPSQRASLTVS